MQENCKVSFGGTPNTRVRKDKGGSPAASAKAAGKNHKLVGLVLIARTSIEMSLAAQYMVIMLSESMCFIADILQQAKCE